MLFFQAIVLGLLQGLTEFLPVSSSGHLQAVPFLFGWPSGSLSFDVMVHAGTLVAVLVYFRSDLAFLATRATGLGGDYSDDERHQARKMVGLLALGSIPAALTGLLFQDVFEAAFGSIRAVAGFLLLTAVLLWSAEHLRARRVARELGRPLGDLDKDERNRDPGRPTDTTTFKDALLIGLAQAMALFPGISRSGATIAAGMSLGLSRAAAARFSFLLAIPIILGATVFQLRDVGTIEAGTLPFELPHIAAGVLAAGISGYIAISFLLKLVQRRSLLVFAGYVAAFAVVLLAISFWTA